MFLDAKQLIAIRDEQGAEGVPEPAAEPSTAAVRPPLNPAF